jgi:hypothetical protein
LQEELRSRFLKGGSKLNRISHDPVSTHQN